MNSNQNSAGRSLFKIAVSVAVVALILSISRLFLSSSDRTSTAFYFAYDLSVSFQMMAFISVIIISIGFLLIGSLIMKEYDIIGVPLAIGGLFSLIAITVMCYLTQSYDHFKGPNSTLAELVLTTVIGIEWLMLLIYIWKIYPVEGDNQIPPVSTTTPQSIPTQQPPTAPPDLNSMLPPSVVNK